MEPHDYRIYCVNIDLRYQYGITVPESQTFLLAKWSLRRDERGETSAVRRLMESIRKGYRFYQKSDIKGKGLDLGAEPPRKKLW